MSQLSGICQKCATGDQCCNTILSSPKIVVSYGFFNEEKNRKTLVHVTLVNAAELCSKHFRSCQAAEMQNETHGIHTILVPSEAFARWHTQYNDVVRRFGIELVEGSLFKGTSTPNGYVPFKDLSLTSLNLLHEPTRTEQQRDDQKIQPTPRGFFGSHKPSSNVMTRRFNPIHKKIQPSSNVMNTPTFNPIQSHSEDSNHNKKTEMDTEIDILEFADDSTEEPMMDTSTLKEIFASHYGPFDPDLRSKPQSKRQSKHWTYEEATHFLELHDKYKYGSVRAASKVLFNQKAFIADMVQGDKFSNRGATNWQNAHNKLLSGEHSLLNKTYMGKVLNSDTQNIETKRIPTKKALELKIKTNKVRQNIEKRRLDRHPIGNIGNDILNQEHMNIGGKQEGNPLTQGMQEHGQYIEDKYNKRNAHLELKKKEFAWKKENAAIEQRQHKEFTNILAKLGMDQEDKKEYVKLCKWVSRVDDARWSGDLTSARCLKIVNDHSSDFLICWQIYEQEDMVAKFQEILDTISSSSV
eukprot:289982_1